MKFIDPSRDPWHSLGGEDGPPISINPAPHLLLEWTPWQVARAHWPQAVPVGVALAVDADVAVLEADLHRLDLITLRFPKWTDGRAYSQARMLRRRYGYLGELRAVGDVVVDMLPLLQRTGFDAVLLRPGQSQEAAERALGFFAGFYQGDVTQPQPLFARPSTDSTAPQTPEFVHVGASI